MNSYQFFIYNSGFKYSFDNILLHFQELRRKNSVYMLSDHTVAALRERKSEIEVHANSFLRLCGFITHWWLVILSEMANPSSSSLSVFMSSLINIPCPNCINSPNWQWSPLLLVLLQNLHQESC